MVGRWIAAVLVLVSLAGAARAEDVADFYRGKTIALLVAAAPGGGVDIAARLLARHMGHYIPGEPAIVPQNMDGAGGLRVANTLANQRDHDGLTLGMHLRGAIQLAVMGDPGARFDPKALSWIGTTSSFKTDTYLLLLRADRGVHNVEELRHAQAPVLLSSVGGASTNVVFALLSRELFGFNVRLIKGYQGSAGTMLAVQRGEVQGTWLGLSSVSGHAREQLMNGGLVPIAQVARSTRHPDWGQVPTGQELVGNEEDRALLSFAESQFYIALPVSGPPNIAADRLAALRQAFMKAHED